MRVNITQLKKHFLIFALTTVIAYGAFAFESGASLQLKANFGGGITMPKISQEGLKDLNPRAYALEGTMSGLLMGFDVEAGYIFRSDKFFGLSKDNPFSGIGVFGVIGFGQGSTGQKISAAEGGETFDIFMTVDFLPVINLELIQKTYFFDNRFAIGVGVGTRMIADMNPKYYLYTSNPAIPLGPEVGNIIITKDMMTKMNPFTVSAKLMFEYNIHIYKTVEFIIGMWGRYSFYQPKYLTVPASMLVMLQPEEVENLKKPQPDYWLNSVDFGVNLGIGFKL